MTRVLAIDIGGTKILAAMVEDGEVLERRQLATGPEDGVEAWLARLEELARPWLGEAEYLGVTVTGAIEHGRWTALNPATLPVPDNFPLADEITRRLRMHPRLANDAQAAAWGEYRHGAGRGRDLVFLTVSTGIGGGIVLNGRLIGGRSGLAGHLGQFEDAEGQRLEDGASGRWIAAEAKRVGHACDTPAIFDAARRGEPWAVAIIDSSAARLAGLCRNVQLMLDPQVIVIGGGVGLAEGYLVRVRDRLASLPERQRPALVAAECGADAGILGIAALAVDDGHNRRT